MSSDKFIFMFPSCKSIKPIADLNECLERSGICSNGGTCIDQNPGYRCECRTGYVGDDCEICENQL